MGDVLDLYKDLKAEGRPVLLRVITTTGADPASGDPGTETVVDHTTRALELEMTFAERSSLARILGSDICMEDKRLLVAALKDDGTALPRPTKADKVVDDGTVYSIVSVSRQKPGNTVLYYEIQVRGA